MYSHTYVNRDTDVIAAFSLVCDLTLDIGLLARKLSLYAAAHQCPNILATQINPNQCVYMTCRLQT